MTKDVIGHLWKQGEKMWNGTNKLLESGGSETKNKFLRAAYKHGVSLYNVSYVNFSHSDSNIEEALSKLEAACKEI